MAVPSLDTRPASDPAPELRGLLLAVVTGGFAALAYATGVAVLSFRYQGFGLSGDQGVGITSREQILIRGGAALVFWVAIGAALFLVVEALPEHRLRVRPRHAVVIALALALPVLVATLHVFWPLLATLAIVLCIVLAERFPRHRLRRMIVCALAVACVAVSYESSRLRFVVESATVELRDPAGQVQGVLISQTERGVYLGDRSRPGGRLVLVFVPEARVVSMTVTPRSQEVNATTTVARRVPIRDRILHALGG